VRNVKGFIAGIVCIVSLAAAPGVFAGQEYILAGGTRAVIEGHRLILIGEKSERIVAPVGVYQIRESGQAIYVTAERIEVRTRPPEIR